MVSLWQSIIRGAFGKCPNCGGSNLFYKYLKSVESCSSCNQYFGDIHADDGPAWLTILIVGHLLAPFLLIRELYTFLPSWMCLSIFLCIGSMLTLFILPRSKGIFIAILWHLNYNKKFKSQQHKEKIQNTKKR